MSYPTPYFGDHPRIDQGEGYRILGEGEVLVEGDEFPGDDTVPKPRRWVTTSHIGFAVGRPSTPNTRCPYRRKIDDRQFAAQAEDFYRNMHSL